MMQTPFGTTRAKGNADESRPALSRARTLVFSVVLLFACVLALAAPLAAHAATLTLYPSGSDARTADWTLSSGTWATSLDTNDGDSSYAYSGTGGSSLYATLDPPSGQAGPIGSVVISAVVRGGGSKDGKVNLGIAGATGAATFAATDFTAPAGTGYATCTYTFPLNPSGGAWTWADVATLKAVVRAAGVPTGTPPQIVGVTQLSATVNYTAITGIAGTVTRGTTPLANIRVRVAKEVNGAWAFQPDEALTASDGTYALALTPDTYRICFQDDSGTYAFEYYSDAASMGSATLVSVTAGNTSTANADLAAAGSLSGTVKNGTTPLAGIYVRFYRQVGGVWTWLVDRRTAADGTYAIGLTPDTYRVFFMDTSGNYVSEYYSDQTAFGSATPVDVVAGTPTIADADLATAARISGTVMSGTTPLANLWVHAYKRVGGVWTSVGAVRTSGTGSYSVVLQPGIYHLYFQDTAGNYVSEYYADQATVAAGTDVEAKIGFVATANADLAAVGHVSGTLRSGTTPLPNINVRVYGLIGGVWTWIADKRTAGDGTYVFTLVPGTYRLYFMDTSGNYASEYYDDKTTFATATLLDLGSAGAITADADLAASVRITGTITSGSTLLTNVWVHAYKQVGGVWKSVGAVKTSSGGTYTHILQPGIYRLYFQDASGSYVSEYYSDKTSLAAATEVEILTGTTTVDADLAAK